MDPNGCSGCGNSGGGGGRRMTGRMIVIVRRGSRCSSGGIRVQC